MLSVNEIVCTAYPVKYHDIEYHDDYIVVTQNKTRRRVYNGWYFEDTGAHIYISDYMVGMFQYKQRQRKFILNRETKEWCDYSTITIEKHKPELKETLENNELSSLKK
jgi:hypothetical protein